MAGYFGCLSNAHNLQRPALPLEMVGRNANSFSLSFLATCIQSLPRSGETRKRGLVLWRLMSPIAPLILPLWCCVHINNDTQLSLYLVVSGRF